MSNDEFDDIFDDIDMLLDGTEEVVETVKEKIDTDEFDDVLDSALDDIGETKTKVKAVKETAKEIVVEDMDIEDDWDMEPMDSDEEDEMIPLDEELDVEEESQEEPEESGGFMMDEIPDEMLPDACVGDPVTQDMIKEILPKHEPSKPVEEMTKSEKMVDEFLETRLDDENQILIDAVLEILRLELAKKEIAENIKDIKSEAKANGVAIAKVSSALNAVKAEIKRNLKPMDKSEYEMYVDLLSENSQVTGLLSTLVSPSD